jgi:hypothetical protein
MRNKIFQLMFDVMGQQAKIRVSLCKWMDHDFTLCTCHNELVTWSVAPGLLSVVGAIALSYSP